MKTISGRPAAIAAIAMLAVPAAGLSAQELEPTQVRAETEADINVYGTLPTDLSGLAAGPDVEGFISARSGREMQVTSEDGTRTTVLVADSTDIKARGGFLGLGREELGVNALLNGLPVSVETVQWEGGLVASQVRFSDSDLETATMIRTGTDQQFAEHGAAIEENAAAAEALRGRVANIDQYNVLDVSNVYFDTGKWDLSPAARRDLCNTAQEANATDNALLLVVGYTDDVGDQDYNQVLSERRAGRVVNYLQQECDWAPWRMLSPTGMSEADPTADNSTPAGRAQNRRVSVNILVSKAVEGM
ncbi:OmpA family protein [Aurantiacibacter hainanensis]|uniref:OmpA family protein n=1 Tax=Aurantiacibacter hainanensis TaxID=3076114 RepID=UPI0030C6FE3B